MKWPTQKVIDECKKAEEWWTQRLPGIIKRGEKEREQWLIEVQCKNMWKLYEQK